MKKNKFTKALACFTASSILVSNMLFAPKVKAIGQFDLNSDVIMEPINQYNTDIAPGVKEKHYSFEDTSGKMTEVFVVDVNLHNSAISIEAGTPDGKNALGMQTVKKQADAVSSGNHTVVAAVNGDYYDMSNGTPFGLVIKNGVPVKDGQFSTWRFFGITKDNKAVIGDPEYYYSIKDNLKEALGGQAIIVKDGQLFEKPEFNAGRNPRTAIGIKADGNVFFLTVDGRQDTYSSGMSYDTLANIMIDLGAVTAIDLDGGGSTTYVSRRPGEDILQVVNTPSDGKERSVANSWLIVSKAQPDHIFNSAFIEPYDKTYTPGSTILFSARGMDKTLAYAPLPANGLSWSLSDPAFGTIDNKGKFLSSGKLGEFQVTLKYNGVSVGNSWIEVQNPDTLYFEDSTFTVGSGSLRPMVLTGKYKKRTISISPNNISWQIPSNLGTIDNNGVLHVAQSPTEGTISATYKTTGITAKADVTIGKLPETIFDFENRLWYWKASSTGKGESGSLVQGSSPSSPVRFGNKSLKLDFDFTNGAKSSTLGVYAGPGEKLQLSGKPTAIGMWVYATPEANGYWLRAAIDDASGSTFNLNLTSGSTGINWVGWKYVEAPLPSVAGPFITNPEQTIRLMSTNSGAAGPMTKGSIYIDNIRAIYGVEEDDLKAPVIDSINVDGKTFNTRSVNIIARVLDYQKDIYKSGINWSKVGISVDNVDYTGKIGNFSYDKDGYVSLSGLNWSTGTHNVTITAEDNAGNQTKKTATFTVQ